MLLHCVEGAPEEVAGHSKFNERLALNRAKVPLLAQLLGPVGKHSGQ
jgi:hypothetical protein